MSRLNSMVTLPAIALLLVTVPVRADHPVEITLLVESFDGCGCLDPFDDPNSCAPCPAGVTSGFPDCDVFGPGSLDLQWRNLGWPTDMLGDNTDPAQGYASQRFQIGDVFSNGSNNPSCGAFGSWEHIWIDFDNQENPTCAAGATIGQKFDFEAARIAQGLPPAAPGYPASIVVAIRRVDTQGTGDTSDVTTKVWMDLSSLSVPSGWPSGTDTPVFTEIFDGTGWQDVIISNLNGYITQGKMNLLVDLGPEGASVDGTLGEKVTVWVDNLRLVYTGLLPDEESDCANGIDDDGDNLIDCEDLDCNGNAACACNQVVLFDTDYDSDVDQADFAFFQTCVTGSGAGPLFDLLSEQCKCLDISGAGGEPDLAIDQSDLIVFEQCASGPGVSANTDCDD